MFFFHFTYHCDFGFVVNVQMVQKNFPSKTYFLLLHLCWWKFLSERKMNRKKKKIFFLIEYLKRRHWGILNGRRWLNWVVGVWMYASETLLTVHFHVDMQKFVDTEENEEKFFRIIFRKFCCYENRKHAFFRFHKLCKKKALSSINGCV